MTWVRVTERDQVTSEILEAAEQVCDGWYAEGPIEWDDFLDRLDGRDFESIGGTLDLGSDMGSPAIRRIKAHIRTYRRA